MLDNSSCSDTSQELLRCGCKKGCYVSASRLDFVALLFANVVDCVLLANLGHSKH